MKRLSLILLASLTLGACDRLGLPDPAKQAALKEEEGKAVGAACRQSGRPLEDCYASNRGSPKAAIFAGWREMNDYMAENKIETVKPEADAAASDDTAESAPQADDGQSKAVQSTSKAKAARSRAAASPKAAK